jgi:hypothetical protein
MPVPYKVKFDDSGTICPRSIIQLREKPECGVYFIQDKPFIPHNKFPLPKGFEIKDIEDTELPKVPTIDKGIIPRTRALKSLKNTKFEPELLPQDETLGYVASRRQFKPNIYERLPTVGEIELPDVARTYEHQENDRVVNVDDVIQNIDRVAPTMIRDLMITDPLEEFPAVLPDPRDTELMETQIRQVQRKIAVSEHENIRKEFESNKAKGKRRVQVEPVEQELLPIEPKSEELVILEEAEKIINKTKTNLTEKEVNIIAKELASRGIPPNRVIEVLSELELFDPALETAIRGMPTKERALMRRIHETIKESSLPRDTNLLPRATEDIDITPDTGLLSRVQQEFGYYGRRANRLVIKTQELLEPDEIEEEMIFEKLPASELTLKEKIQQGQSELREQIVKGGKRLFAQEYKPLKLEEPLDIDIQMEEPTDIRLRVSEPIQPKIEGLGDIPLAPLDRPLAVRGAKPKLSFAERISAPRVADVALGAAHPLGGIGIGLGVSALLGETGVDKYTNAALSGAMGDAGGRILSNVAENLAVKTGIKAGEVAGLTGKTLLKGSLEGGLISLATLPIDMALNNALRKRGLSHTQANMTSTGIVGGGTIATLGTFGVVNAPETGGATLLLAGLAIGALELIAFITGQSEDKEIENRNNIAIARSKLIDTLPKYNYNLKNALEAFKDKNSLGMKEDDWEDWSAEHNAMFKDRPSQYHRKEKKDKSGLSDQDKEKINKYFTKYMLNNLIKKTCASTDTCSPELTKLDKGELTNEEKEFLDNKTDKMWEKQADLQVNTTMKQLEYQQIRIKEAKTFIINNWDNEKKLPKDLDPYWLQTAKEDPEFEPAFRNAVKLQAQKIAVDAYLKDQTTLEQLPANIQRAAQYDKGFGYYINMFYNDMRHTAGKLNVSVPQLIELQKLSGSEQKNKYREFQFDDAKKNKVLVSEARDITKEEDAVRDAGYYDIDQAYLETDPTAIGLWKPSDSQILQAHSAGMTLQQYVNYMHELAKGKVGDYNKLPQYSKEVIRSSGILDFSHFQDELQIAGYNPNLYSYNPETLKITLNPNISNQQIPETQNKFISSFTPKRILKARQEIADLAHGLDHQNQNLIDTYNAKLHEQLSGYGKNYDKMVASINDERSYQGINTLLHYDVEGQYNKYKMEFKPVNIVQKDPTTLNSNEATENQLANTPNTGSIPEPQKDYLNEYGEIREDITG